MGSSIMFASSCVLAKERTAVVVIETASEEDRFYRNWLRGAMDCRGPILAGSGLHVVAAVPTVAEAVQDPEFVEHLVSLVSTDHRPHHRRR